MSEEAGISKISNVSHLVTYILELVLELKEIDSGAGLLSTFNTGLLLVERLFINIYYSYILPDNCVELPAFQRI